MEQAAFAMPEKTGLTILTIYMANCHFLTQHLTSELTYRELHLALRYQKTMILIQTATQYDSVTVLQS